MPLLAQSFGQNKVNYEAFEWHYLRTENFLIYHPKESYEVAEFTGWSAEDALQQIQKSFDYTLRNRITIVVYPSHNTFTETNVSSGIQEESVGGFTEFLKDRVVIPFEGSYEKFRHVIHHELTHAVMLRMIYGEGMGSIITGIYRAPMPLWFIEGLAEYTSRFGWDKEADMYMRDAVINDYLPPIDRLGGYFYYKGGQSVLYYIQERYGAEKVSEILHKMRSSRDLNRAIKLSIGMDIEELSKRWHRYLKREIWPNSVDYEAPDDFAEKISDHNEWYNFVNNSPALSPDGDKLVILSDKSDYFSLYLISTVTGKITRRLVQGEKNDLFEQMHWMRPGIDWSPDSRQITFAAKAGEQDALYTLDIKSEEITNVFKFDLDALFSPAWSPDGKKIAFVGVLNGQSDIYTVTLDGYSTLSKITDDVFSDFDPAWDLNGNRLLFTSDRGDNYGENLKEVDIWNHDYSQIDIYMKNIQTGETTRITNDQSEDRTPKWTPRSNLLSFVSDRNGVHNLYLHDIYTGEEWACTDVLTGVFQPSWSKMGTVAFASFFDAGYDVYLYKNPFDSSRIKHPALTGHMKKNVNKKNLPKHHVISRNNQVTGKATPSMAAGNLEPSFEEITVDTTINYNEMINQIARSNKVKDETVMEDSSSESDSTNTDEEKKKKETPIKKKRPANGGVRLVPDETEREEKGVQTTPYTNYVFKPYYRDAKNRYVEEIDSSKFGPLIDENGKFIQNKYKVKFSPDIVNAVAGYSTFFGLQGEGVILFSDVLGNHQMYVTTDLYYSFENSNFSFYYYYQPHRIDIGGGFFHNVYFFDRGWIRDRNYGASFNARYPLSRYERIEFSSAFVNIDREDYIDSAQDYWLRERRHFVLPTISYVSDNTVWGWTGPINGRRWRIGFSYSPEMESGAPTDTVYTLTDSSIVTSVVDKDRWGIDFKTLSFDARQYFHVARDYSFALRLAGATSWGKNPQRFFMGGVGNWINRRFASREDNYSGLRENIDDIYFSGFATPMRGGDYYEKEGTNYILTNSEFRFPLVHQMLFGWPLPLFFYNIRGALFMDLGAAWGTADNRYFFRGIDTDPEDQVTRFDDIAMGYGWGFRVNLGLFLLKWDMAWENTYSTITKPSYYFSIGADY